MPPDLCPVADGGEGTLEALLTALGGETAGARVHDPLGREVDAGFALLEGGGTAVVEGSQASGLGLVAEDERDAEAASSRGTGELIAAAVDAGAEFVPLAFGGSATTDGGAGALIEGLTEAGGLRGARLVCLCDVRTPFERAAEVFAPQKGADAAAVSGSPGAWPSRPRGLAPRDPTGVPLTGCAGGLSGGLWAAFDAVLEPGAAFVLDALGYDERMRAARRDRRRGGIDDQTLQGKIAGEAATRARQAGVPCFAIVGRDELDAFGARLSTSSASSRPTTSARSRRPRQLRRAARAAALASRHDRLVHAGPVAGLGKTDVRHPARSLDRARLGVRDQPEAADVLGHRHVLAGVADRDAVLALVPAGLPGAATAAALEIPAGTRWWTPWPLSSRRRSSWPWRASNAFASAGSASPRSTCETSRPAS